MRSRPVLVTLVLGAVVALLATGCDLHLLAPQGAGPLRYRDPVFSAVTIARDVPYGKAQRQSGSMQTLVGDLYYPNGDLYERRPAIVWVHGGGFRQDGGDLRSPEIVDEATTFAKKGFVGFSIEYRTFAKGCAPFGDDCFDAIRAAWHDAQAAVRFLRRYATTYKIDPDRIAIAGTSAGAITAYNVAYGSDEVGHSGNPGYSSKVRAAVSLSGAALLTSPSAGEPPTLDFHGTTDGLVPYQWSSNTIKDAKAVGLVAERTTWEGDGHVPYAKHRQQILDETTNFLWHTMDLRHAL